MFFQPTLEWVKEKSFFGFVEWKLEMTIDGIDHFYCSDFVSILQSLDKKENLIILSK